MAGEVTVTGLAEVQRMLTEAPKAIAGSIFVRAMDAAVQVIEDELYILAPERDEGERDENEAHIKDLIMHLIELDSRFRGVRASIGFGKGGHKALWLEYGHRMIGHAPGHKDLGMVRPHPFIRRAFDNCADKAIAAFTRVFEDGMRTLYG